MNSTFSPVLVDRFSIRMRSRGTPIATAIPANWSASGSLHRCLVIAPSPPEKMSSGAQPSRNSCAPRSATAVSWLQSTRMTSAGDS